MGCGENSCSSGCCGSCGSCGNGGGRELWVTPGEVVLLGRFAHSEGTVALFIGLAFLLCLTVSYLLGNPDDMRNNYNNYYLYFVPSTGKCVVIPYDFDRCFGLTYEWNPTGNGVTQDDPFTDRLAASDNNGAGYKERQDFKYLVCVNCD